MSVSSETCRTLIKNTLRLHPEGMSITNLVDTVQANRHIEKPNISSVLTTMVAHKEVLKLSKRPCSDCGRPTIYYKLGKVQIDASETAPY